MSNVQCPMSKGLLALGGLDELIIEQRIWLVEQALVPCSRRPSSNPKRPVIKKLEMRNSKLEIKLPPSNGRAH